MCTTCNDVHVCSHTDLSMGWPSATSGGIFRCCDRDAGTVLVYIDTDKLHTMYVRPPRTIHDNVLGFYVRGSGFRSGYVHVHMYIRVLGFCICITCMCLHIHTHTQSCIIHCSSLEPSTELPSRSQ